MSTANRLITSFVPDHYDLHISIDRIGRKFHGTVAITGTSISDRAIIHAKDLALSSIDIDGKRVVFTIEKNDEVHINLPTGTSKKCTLTVAYSGVITDALHGLYPCYFTVDGEKKELLATQFESHYAREMFPCIDEPEAKATFDVTVTTELGITVLGNMPVESSREEGGLLVTKFQTTPRMSTYLLALVMGELQSVSAHTKKGVEVNIWSTKAHPLDHLDYALKSSVDCIEFFNDYFGIDYPLPKADHVAVPDFDAGAMENWGLITYRESALLIDPKNSSLPNRQYAVSVIAHELSHQWFGNLVTMKWWNNLWLNESFASIMENIASHALHPEWNVWLDFSAQDGIAAIRRDAIAGVQAVQTDVNHPDEISSLFDGAIVYAKGARLMRMCEAYIGEDAFRQGLMHYFKLHAYKNTDEHDLWRAFSEASGKDVGAFMTPWITQSGYPVVHASYDGTTLHLAQKQFFVGEPAESDAGWPIPLDTNVASIPQVMTEPIIDIPLDTAEHIILNSHDTGHYIVAYDDTLLSRLIDAIKAGKLDEIGRMKLLSERIMLARSGTVDPASLVDILEAYTDESSEPVWDMISLAVSELRKYVESSEPSEAKLKQLVHILSSSNYQRLGWQPLHDEPINDIKLRPRIIANMLYSEDEQAIAQAVQLADTTPAAALSADLRSVILGAKVRYGSDVAYMDKLVRDYASEASPEMRDDLRAAITTSKDPKALELIISKLTDKSIIRPQDTMYWYVQLLSNRYSREEAWQWLQREWKWIEETFGSDKSFDYYPRYSGQILNTRQQSEEYRRFFTPMLTDVALRRTIEMGLTDIEGRVSLIERFSSSVESRLDNL